jgi:hypothetical protein
MTLGNETPERERGATFLASRAAGQERYLPPLGGIKGGFLQRVEKVFLQYDNEKWE